VQSVSVRFEPKPALTGTPSGRPSTEGGDEQMKKSSARKRLLSLQELFDFGLGLGEIPRNLEDFESVRVRSAVATLLLLLRRPHIAGSGKYWRRVYAHKRCSR
jgi:hypothetical protein